jgi:membrane protease YdiL (CAAX protease family)
MKTSVRVVLFYILAFVFLIIFGGVQLKVLKMDFYTISLPQLAPGLAALVMLVIFRKENVRLTIAVTGAQTLKYIGAVGIPLLVSGVLFLSYSQFIGPLNIQPISGIPLLILLGGQLLGAFGEELGWRGYLQRIVEGKANVLIASLLVGVLWGLWHVIYYQNGPIWMLFFVFSTLAYSVIMSWLLKGTDYNVVIAGLFHFAVNVGYYILSAARPDYRLMMLIGLVWGVVAVVIIVLNSKYFLSPHKI